MERRFQQQWQRGCATAQTRPLGRPGAATGATDKRGARCLGRSYATTTTTNNNLGNQRPRHGHGRSATARYGCSRRHGRARQAAERHGWRATATTTTTQLLLFHPGTSGAPGQWHTHETVHGGPQTAAGVFATATTTDDDDDNNNNNNWMILNDMFICTHTREEPLGLNHIDR